MGELDHRRLNAPQIHSRLSQTGVGEADDPILLDVDLRPAGEGCFLRRAGQGDEGQHQQGEKSEESESASHARLTFALDEHIDQPRPESGQEAGNQPEGARHEVIAERRCTLDGGRRYPLRRDARCRWGWDSRRHLSLRRWRRWLGCGRRGRRR